MRKQRGPEKQKWGHDIRPSVRRLGLIHIQGQVLLQVTSVLGK